MAEKILVLMADLDGETQKILSGWYDELTLAGFEGKQTLGLPYHITMSTYPLEKEAEAVELMKKADEMAVATAAADAAADAVAAGIT